MRRFLLKLNKYFETVISCGGDKPVICLNGENACCKRLKLIDRLHIPEIGAYWIAVNYCFVCGKKLERKWTGLKK